MGRKKDKTTKISGFIDKLVKLLKDTTTEGIVEYIQQDKSFTIKNIRRFTEQVLPVYFKHRNYSSFVRQVNLYGFHKQKIQQKQEIYFHENFCINDVKMLRKIKRKKNSTQKEQNRSQQFGIQDGDCEQDEESYYRDEKEKQENLQELIKRRQLLKAELKREEESYNKLKSQNQKLKTTYQSQNRLFYQEGLRIIQNMLQTQLRQGNLSQKMYIKIYNFIQNQRQNLNEQYFKNLMSQNQTTDVKKTQQNNDQNIQKQKQGQDQNEHERVKKQPRFWSLLKKIINKQSQITADSLIEQVQLFVRQHNKHLSQLQKQGMKNDMNMNEKFIDKYPITSQKEGSYNNNTSMKKDGKQGQSKVIKQKNNSIYQQSYASLSKKKEK